MDRFRQLSIFLACGFGCILAGCCTHCGGLLCNGCNDIPPGAIPQPNGSHACAWQTAQNDLAERDDFIIYQYEWQGESAQLGPFGQRHVTGLTQRLETQPHQITIEPSENASLDAERQAALTAILTAAGLPDAESRVHLGYEIAEGLHGQEATQMERGYFRSGSRNGGLNRGGGGGGLGGGIGRTGGF